MPEDAVKSSDPKQRFVLSPKALAEGWRGITILPPGKVRAAELKAYLQDTIYDGDSAWLIFLRPVLYMTAAALFLYTLWLVFGHKVRISRKQEQRHGRRTKGPELVSAFNIFRSSGDDGVRFRMERDGVLGRVIPGPSFSIPRRLESSHILLMGDTGSGKTTTLAVVREGAEREGYTVQGFAPTSRAAQKLSEAGIETSTLQMHLARGQKPDTGERRLYVLDESSLASTKQMHEFLTRLHPNDRVLLVGDKRQHEAVEAGRPFAQLQQAGMKTVSLDQIVRQRDPELKQVVEQLAQGDVGGAIQRLDQQGRIHEFKGREERIEAIAKEYAKNPKNTLVVSPDNRSRMEINQVIHAELQVRGIVNHDEHATRTLVPRQELTGAARTWAENYEVGDVVRYSRASKETGIGKGEYARVTNVDARSNRVTVETKDGSERSYDPRRQSGVSVYREEERTFSVGDRVQFTAPANELKVANRELGTVERIKDGRMSLRMDDGRNVQIDPAKHPHIDHGYAVTSHSSQGQTADRVLVHVDTELAAKDLLNNRMAYVAISRGAEDAQLFTNDRDKLGQALGRDVSQQSAHTPQIGMEKATLAPETKIEMQIEHGYGYGIGR